VTDGQTHYEVLGIEPRATKEEIKAAYQERLDDAQAAQARESASKRPNESALASARDEEAQARSAWQVLSDPYQRGRYDASIDVPEDVDNEVADGEIVDDDEPAGRGGRGGNGAARQPRKSRRAQLDANRPPVFTEDGTQLELAQTGRRATAAAIDVVIMIGVYFAIITIVDALTAFKKDSGPAFAVSTGTLVAVVFAFLVIPTVFSGQSIGKRFTKVMLVDKTTGHLPTPSRVLLHYLPAIAALLILPGFGAPLALMIGLSFLLTRDGLSLGDKVSKSVVVIARYRPERVR
jgi:uncharacterized RDD family membrane protein YckC